MKTIINTTNAPKAIGPYNQAIEAGGMIFISGQIPISPETGQIIEGGIAEQTKQVLKNMEAILTEAGLSMANVVKTTCLLSSMDNFAAMNKVYAEFFTENMPARAAYGVVKLPMGVMVEIEAIAVR
ncbi:MAG: RidA family protein [Bacteroidales bacterium]